MSRKECRDIYGLINIDKDHRDFAGTVIEEFDAGCGPDAHGTARGNMIVGAIAARRNLLGVAPDAKILAICAFYSSSTGITDNSSSTGITDNIIKGIDYAIARGARVINMSFAGPPDPRLRDALRRAYKEGIVLIAAAGNAGPNSAPLYPGAFPGVIAVTATDEGDRLFPGSNRGTYIAVAAPGVNVFAAASDGAYQLVTGTSVAAAEVSGIAALLIERNPALTPAAVRKILMQTAKPLGPKSPNRDFGAGLANAFDALRAAMPNIGQ
jgi:subtilisin family serine protease